MRSLAILLMLSLLGCPAAAQQNPDKTAWRADLDALRKALRAGDLNEAANLAHGLSKAEPRLRAAWEVLAAVEMAESGAVSDEIRAHLAAPVPRPPESTKPASGDSLYVQVSALRMRSKPSRRGKVLGLLPMNAPVKVTAVKGAWVGIDASLPPTPAPELVFGVAAAPGSEPSDASGFTKWSFLGSAPLAKDELAADADVLALRGAVKDAVSLYIKALFLDPDDQALRRRLVAAALDAQRFALAYRTMIPLANQAAHEGSEEDSGDWEVGDMASYFGCRGDKRRMTLVDVEDGWRAIARAPKNACLGGVQAIGDCSPRDPFSGGYNDANSYCEDEENRGGQSYEDCQADVDSQMEEHSKEQARWQKRADAFRARLDKLREKFPGSGWVQFLIHANPGAPSLKKDKLFAYSVSYDVRICQDYTMTCNLGEADLTQYGLPFEVDETSGVMEVWVESPSTSGVIVGLIAAEDRDAALAELRAHPRIGSEEQEASNCAPAPNVVMPVPDCHCESEAVTE